MIVRSFAVIAVALLSACASSPPARPQAAPRPDGDLLEEKIPFGVYVEHESSDCEASFARINKAWEQASVCERDTDCEKSYGNCAAARAGAAHEAVREAASAAMKACQGSLLVPVCDEETTPVCVERKCRVRRRTPSR